MEELSFLEHISIAGASTEEIAAECCSEDTSVLDLDYFIKTVSGIKAQGVRPDLIGSFLATYASKWLPELSEDHATNPTPLIFHESPQNLRAKWMKKRFIVESLVGILPPEKDCVSCDFLLRLLRCGNMVGLLDPTCQIELENRISQQLYQASVKELMIPLFSSHTGGTVLNIELVIRLVIRFTNLDGMNTSVAALVKVAKLVDSYLAEAATDPNLNFSQFIALAAALPSYARATYDGLYQAIDTYLKVNKGASKKERKSLWRLIDVSKLSSNASLHASQNERLPVRAVIQVVYSEHARNINRQSELSASSIGTTSFNPVHEHSSSPFLSRNAQHKELKKLREDVHKLQLQYYRMQVQMEKLMEKKKGSLFKWKKLRFGSLQGPVNVIESVDVRSGVTSNLGFEHYTPTSKMVGNPRHRRKSVS